MIRVLIIDDSTFVRQALTRMLASDPGIEVVGSASDGNEGHAKACALRPDVITLDVRMPRMDGLEALRRIMKDCPTPVLLLSSHTSEGADVTLRGLEIGAMDFVDKSSVQGHMNLLELAEELKAKVRALASIPKARVVAALSPRPWPAKPARLPARVAHGAEVVVIGTSTGGPPALQAIIPRLPEGFQSAVLVVQHMPVGFTRSLAERLDSRSVLNVREAVDGEAVTAGSVLVAPAGRHMKVRRRGRQTHVWLDDEPRSAAAPPVHRRADGVRGPGVRGEGPRRRPDRHGLRRRPWTPGDPGGRGPHAGRERRDLRHLRHAQGGRGGRGGGRRHPPRPHGG